MNRWNLSYGHVFAGLALYALYFALGLALPVPSCHRPAFAAEPHVAHIDQLYPEWRKETRPWAKAEIAQMIADEADALDAQGYRSKHIDDLLSQVFPHTAVHP